MPPGNPPRGWCTECKEEVDVHVGIDGERFCLVCGKSCIGARPRSLADELGEVKARLKALEEQRADIYRRSLEAPEHEKVCGDFLAEMMAEGPAFPTWPIEVSAINWSDSPSLEFRRVNGPTLVSVRPASEEKTYVGVYVGDLPMGVGLSYHRESKVLTIQQGRQNPAIVVPALKRVVMGCESWWAPIKDEAELRQITNEDIDNLWYVQALKELVK